VLEPQSTPLFLLLMLVFGGLVVCAVLAKQPVFRLLAACLAFVPAMLFGVAAVNKYYGYYETWSAVVADFTSRGVQSIPQISAAGAGSARQFNQILGNSINSQRAARTGAVIGVKTTGITSRLTRDVLIYLPPQYFQKQYARYRFPALELIHGQPGEPEDWLAALDVQTTMQSLIAEHLVDPAVLVMPDVNGGRKISLQCVNQVGGPADDNFVALDVPRYVAARIRVQAPGPAWGIAGYSEGGYCAANLALRHPQQFGFAGVMSGYFQPMFNRVEYKHTIRSVDPFRHDAALRRQNSPIDMLRDLPAGSRIPQFWVAAARAVRVDVLNAIAFVALLRVQDPATPLTITPNGAHNAVAWRSMILPMLEWMTPRLAQAAAAQSCQACVVPATGAAAPAAPTPSPSATLHRPLARPSQGPARGRATPPVAATRPAALGVGHPLGTALHASG